MSTYASRNPLAATSPLRSCQWGRPAYLVMGLTAMQKAELELQTARNNVPGLVSAYALCRAELGRANKAPIIRRRRVQSAVMRGLNTARAALRRALRRVALAELALAALAVAQA